MVLGARRSLYWNIYPTYSAGHYIGQLTARIGSYPWVRVGDTIIFVHPDITTHWLVLKKEPGYKDLIDVRWIGAYDNKVS